MADLTLNQLALKHLRIWELDEIATDEASQQLLALELGQLGFKVKLLMPGFLNRLSFSALISALKEMRGGNVEYIPLFNNFPDERPTDYSYFLQRVLGAWGINVFDESKFGADPISQRQRQDLFRAAVDAQEKRVADSRVEWIEIEFVSSSQLQQRLCQWVQAELYHSSPVKEALWTDLFKVIEILNPPIIPSRIAIKETLARVAARFWQLENKLLLHTPTDLLRLFAFLREQDVSLAQPVSFKGLKLSRPQRQVILQFLSSCPNLEEDLLRHKGLWVKCLESLHPGDYKKRFGRAIEAFDNLRNNRIKSYASRLLNAPLEEQLAIALERPGELIRRAGTLAKIHGSSAVSLALKSLRDVDSIPLPLLMTAYCTLNADEAGSRLVINKVGKFYVGDKAESSVRMQPVVEALEVLILLKLSATKDWDTVWIDPALFNIVIPLQARKQSDGLLNLARGTRIQLCENCNILRLFVYWHQKEKRTDLDLSVLMLDEQFTAGGHVAWNSYGDDAAIIHSGDIQSAELGASEFIDVDLRKKLNCRYILPSVIRYCGESFTQLEACHAGWMLRTGKSSQYQAFDPKTVAQKVEIHGEGVVWVPFLLDVVDRELIYVDIVNRGSRTIERNSHFPRLAAAISKLSTNRPTFGKLAHWYALANNAKVVSKEKASTTIGIHDDCTVNVFGLKGQQVISL
jgi:hypothetical protein